MKNAIIGVVYLCWVPFGPEYFTAFIDSYHSHNAGVDHKLIIIFKGFRTQIELDPFISIVEKRRIPFSKLYYTGNGLDIATYYWCAKQLDHDKLLFLNSKSRVLIDNWLVIYSTCSNENTATVISATGSWQSYSSSVFKAKSQEFLKHRSFAQKLDSLRSIIKASTLWWYYFPLFPNPHIRTNAFFIDRHLFLSLEIGDINSKIDAYRFESGRNGFTKQLFKKGYKIALVTKSGELYHPENWVSKKIFWSGLQEDLIVSDNQTDLYTQADEQTKTSLEKQAWG